jgi:hypothetical protein
MAYRLVIDGTARAEYQAEFAPAADKSRSNASPVLG